MEWYYIKDGRRLGPVPDASIRAWLETGFLGGGDLLWRSGMTDWARISELPEFGARGPAGRDSGAPGAGPDPFLIGTAPPPPEGCRGYAGFWLRAGAYLIDVFILSLVLLIFWRPQVKPDMTPEQMMEMMKQLQANVALMVGQFLLSWAYWSLLESSPWQATLGKKAFHLKVTDLDGRRLTFLRASLRQVAKVISEFTFLLGFVLAAFTPRKQALHDLLARCLVVRK
jgi:uncharacterized RDD family membrane protein YckC